MKQLVDVIPQYVNPAKPGKKYGSIKLADGTKHLVPAGMVKQLRENAPSKVEIVEENWKDGPVTIIKWTSPPDAATTAQRQITRPAAAPREARQIGIFAAAKLVAPIPFGTVDQMTHAITSVLLAAARSYDRVLAGSQTQARDDLNDEIPEGDWAVKSENPAEGIEDTF